MIQTNFQRGIPELKTQGHISAGKKNLQSIANQLPTH